jgi:pilus assembly protein CpaB
LRTRLLTITLAAVLAMLGIVAVLAYVHQANERAVNGLKAQTVVIAAHAIPAGTSLSTAQNAHWLSTEKVPDSSLTSPVVHSLTAANAHLVTRGNVPKGWVLLQNMLAKPGTLTAGTFGPVLPVPKGDIGVAMEMCLAGDVAGYVQPGSYIAVFDTYSPGQNVTYTCTSHQAPSKGMVFSKVVAARVEVLAVKPASSVGTSATVGQLASADPANPASPVASSGEVLVTLAATSQAQAENLVLATTAGYPTYGLLADGTVLRADGPYHGALQP